MPLTAGGERLGAKRRNTKWMRNSEGRYVTQRLACVTSGVPRVVLRIDALKCWKGSAGECVLIGNCTGSGAPNPWHLLGESEKQA